MHSQDRRKEPESRQMLITTGSWVRGVVVVAGILVLFHLRDLLLVILTAIVIASAIEPATLWAQKKRIPRMPTVLGVYILMAVAMAGLFYFLFLPLLGEVSSFLNAFPAYSTQLAQSDALGNFFDTSGLFGNAAGGFAFPDIFAQVNNLLLSFSQGVFSSISIAFGGVLSLIIIIVLSFYLGVQEDGVAKFLRVITPWSHEKYVVSLWKRSQTKIGLWMQGQLLLAA
ncbi:MAG: AI-2E family transporter, partial [Parcubacteria group bacterium]